MIEFEPLSANANQDEIVRWLDRQQVFLEIDLQRLLETVDKEPLQKLIRHALHIIHSHRNLQPSDPALATYRAAQECFNCTRDIHTALQELLGLDLPEYYI